MASQPVPQVSRKDVERIVRRDFPPVRQAEAFALLEQYGSEEWHRDPDRVHLAALKLAAGSIDSLQVQIGEAAQDYRDVIGPAEYPGYLKRWSRIPDAPFEEQGRIIDADWRQYQEWLAR